MSKTRKQSYIEIEKRDNVSLVFSVLCFFGAYYFYKLWSFIEDLRCGEVPWGYEFIPVLIGVFLGVIGIILIIYYSCETETIKKYVETEVIKK